jgi:hypothetical protein
MWNMWTVFSQTTKYFPRPRKLEEILTGLSSISPRFWGVEFRAESSPNNVH